MTPLEHFHALYARLNAMHFEHPDVQRLSDEVDAAWFALTDAERLALHRADLARLQSAGKPVPSWLVEACR
jgi:hypothetical protein